ncbi:MAG: peptidoglycan DD-metalloendopeptidase family protein [Firmicutes bacterium]|nr:peptidoglycan DD-metalloendopeptidase family protein [Bacillota bacterium]
MKKPMKKLLLLFLVIAVVLAIGTGVYAGKVDDLQNQKQEIDSQIKDKQEDLEANKDAQDAAQAQLDAINANLEAVQAEITRLYNELAIAEENLARQQEEYNEIKANLDQSQKALQNRVNAIYRNGDISYWDVLFSSENVQDFISGFIFLTKIVEEDQKIIDSIRENKILAEEKLHELQVTRNEIVALQIEKEAEEAEYAKQAEAKLALLDVLESEQAALEKEIDEMEAQSGSIASEINSYYASLSASDPGYTYTGSGIFTWPLSTGGTLTSNYGYRIHPISGVRKMHTGIDLAAPAGTPIVAAESGTVSLVRKLGTGYGWYVVVSHGSNISTLYAHMSSIIVTQGQVVSRGQKLGGVGTTGSSTGNHLHFEVRVNGSHVSPWGYISR